VKVHIGHTHIAAGTQSSTVQVWDLVSRLHRNLAFSCN
jgi:hypothetical protein